jgi:glyoxylase-like metal-dependent hydrolase (beta-lactamase superfamily II)
VFVPVEGVFYSGDSVVAGYLPNLEAGEPDDWRVWLTSLDRIESLAPSALVPGHGPILRDAEVGAALTKVRRVIEEAITQGHAPTQ